MHNIDKDFYSRLLAVSESFAYRAKGEDRKLLFVSGSFERLTGVAHDEALDTELSSMVHRMNQNKVFEVLRNASGSFNLEYRIVRNGRKPLWVRDRGIIYTGDDGERYIDGIITDISKPHRIKSDRQKFLSGLANELRMPMSSVIGFLELSLDMLDEDDVIAGYLGTAKKSAGTVLRLLNDFSDVNILGFTSDSDKEVFNLYEMLESSVYLYSQSDRKNLADVRLIYDPDMSRCFRGDKARMRRVIHSLLEEACVKSREKTVTVKVFMEGGLVNICVMDSGAPMTRHELKTLFVPAAGSGRSKHLNYTVCKRLADLMNSELTAESSSDGNLIRLRTEMRAENCEGGCIGMCYSGKESESRARSFDRAFHILLAEDVQENADLAAIRLGHKGHRVDVVSDGREAAAMYAKHSYDAVLIDVHMPVMDGIRAAEKMRSHGKKKYVPIIGMTSGLTSSVRQKCLEAGMDSVFAKPLDFSLLFEKLDRLVPIEQGFTVRKIDCDDDAEIDFSSLDAFADVKAGIRIWGGSSMFLSALKDFASSHRNCAEELWGLIISDVPAAYKYAHRIKNVISSLGCDSLYGQIADIESWLFVRDTDVALMLHEDFGREMSELIKAVDSIDIK